MRRYRMAALGALTLALILSACSTGGSSPAPSTAPATSATAPSAAASPSAPASAAATIASTLVLGGPPECPQRPACLLGLKSTYGLDFKEFKPLDSGGPLTVAALDSGDIGVGCPLYLGSVDRGQGLRPARGRQAAPELGQHRPGHPPGDPRQEPRGQDDPGRDQRQADPGRTHRDQQGRRGRQAGSGRRGQGLADRPRDPARAGWLRQGQDRRRVVQLPGVDDARRDLRTGPRRERLRRREEAEHRQS